MGFIENNGTVIVAIATAFTAFAAVSSIILVSLSFSAQNKYHRIAISPAARIVVGDYSNNVFVRLPNDGLGPMIIDRLEIIQNGKILDNNNIFDMMPIIDNIVLYRHFTAIPDKTIIAAQSQRTLLDLRIDPSNQDHVHAANSVRATLGCLTLRCYYSDLFGNGRPTIQRELTWFLRRFSETRPITEKR